MSDDYNGEERRGAGCNGTCGEPHEAQTKNIKDLGKHIEALTISNTEPTSTWRAWGKMLGFLFLIMMAVTGFSVRGSISLITSFLSRVESVETKQAEAGKQIAVNTQRLDVLETWRYDHIMEDRDRDAKVKLHSEHDERRFKKIDKGVIRLD